VVWAGAARKLRANPAEVAGIHRIPIAEFMRADAPWLDHEDGSEQPVLRMPVGQTWIAAPTAAVLYQFRELCIAGRPDTRGALRAAAVRTSLKDVGASVRSAAGQSPRHQHGDQRRVEQHRGPHERARVPGPACRDEADGRQQLLGVNAEEVRRTQIAAPKATSRGSAARRRRSVAAGRPAACPRRRRRRR
jgi:hypothetical protein